MAVLLIGISTVLEASDQDPERGFRVLPSAIKWKTEVPDGPVAPPVIEGDHVVVAVRSGALIATRVADGSDAWITKIAAITYLAAADQTILAIAERAAHALSAETGEVKWTRAIKAVTAPPLFRGGWIILASGEELTALRATDGGVVWTQSIAPILQRSTIDGDTLYVPLVDGRLVALDLATGAVRWEKRIGPSPSEALVFGDRVYIGAGGKHFLSLKIANGAEDWNFPLGSATIGVAAADESYVYVASMDNLLRAFRRSNGAREWAQDVGYRPTGGPMIMGSTVSVPGRTAVLRAFERTTKKESAQLALPYPAVTLPALGPPRKGKPGTLAVISNDHGKPWLLVLAAEPPPAPPSLPALSPLSAPPGTSLPIPKYPI